MPPALVLTGTGDNQQGSEHIVKKIQSPPPPPEGRRVVVCDGAAAVLLVAVTVTLLVGAVAAIWVVSVSPGLAWGLTFWALAGLLAIGAFRLIRGTADAEQDSIGWGEDL